MNNQHFHYKSDSGDGFQPLRHTPSNQRDHIVDIPLTPIMSHRSKEEDSLSTAEVIRPQQPRQETQASLGPANMFGKNMKRKLNRTSAGPGGQTYTVDGEPDALTKVGRFYETVLNFSFITRYILYIIPLALLLAIPILIGATSAKGAELGGVRIVWIFAWSEIVWVSLWVSKVFAKCLPYIFKTLVGVVSSGTRKYYKVIQALEIPLSLVGWAFTSWISFKPIMTGNPDQRAANDRSTKPWERKLNQVLAAALVSALVYLAKCILIQIISVRYHQVQFSLRIKNNKEKIKMLTHLYAISRDIFPSYCPEFAEEDYILHASIAGNIMTPGHKRSGSNTPMKLIGQMARVGDNLTSALGNVAKEITGKDLMNPNSAYSTVLDALQRKASSEALARRVWMSFVEEGKETLFVDDLVEVMGYDNRTLAREAFAVLDHDDNGDVSLEEMVSAVVEISRERKSMAKSMGDIDSAISALDSLISVIIFIVVIFIFVAFLNTSFSTTLATAGTALLSLSFVFAMTAQEILGSCIFIFVKHPYDVGDRVDFDGNEYFVEHIALLYTIFRSNKTNKTNQVPNNVLNSKQIENVSRSKAMHEIVKFDVHFETSMEDIMLLRNELFVFVEENNRDFRPENLNVEISDMTLGKLELKVEIKHKGNWADESKRMERRNKFMTALVAALRKVPIYAPGSGDPSLGESGKPSYTVAISAGEAQERIEQAKKDKAAKRLANKQEEAVTDSPPLPASAHNSNAFPGSLTSVTQDYTTNGTSTAYEEETTRSRMSLDSIRRRDVEATRDLLRRQSTTGRRRRTSSGSPYPSVHQIDSNVTSMYPVMMSPTTFAQNQGAAPMYTEQNFGIQRQPSLRSQQPQSQFVSQQRTPSPAHTPSNGLQSHQQPPAQGQHGPYKP